MSKYTFLLLLLSLLSNGIEYNKNIKLDLDKFYLIDPKSKSSNSELYTQLAITFFNSFYSEDNYRFGKIYGIYVNEEEFSFAIFSKIIKTDCLNKNDFVQEDCKDTHVTAFCVFVLYDGCLENISIYDFDNCLTLKGVVKKQPMVAILLKALVKHNFEKS